MPGKNLYCTEVQMQIRKPVSDVFEAFINPERTKHFWFTKGSAKLEVNKKVTWEWEMYNVSATVLAKEILDNEKIVFEWGSPSRTVEIAFSMLHDDSTYVVINEWGYIQTGDELLAVIKDSTGGFTTVLDGLKAYMEHGIDLNLIGDKFPREIIQHGNISSS